MSSSSRPLVLKSLLALVFIGLLGLPIFLEQLSRAPEEALSDTLQESALKLFDFYLEEVSNESGITFVHQSPVLDPEFTPIMPQIASMGASVSICDFDCDGWNDIYVTNSRYGSKNALYHNQQDGSFKEVGGTFGLADLNQKGTGVSMGAVWADYDNDGYEDVFIYKWGRPELYRNLEGSGFISATQASGLPAWINANTAIWLDYDSDGYVDLFIGGYFPEDLDLWNLEHTAVLTESFEYAINGGRNYLFKNDGKGGFEDVTDQAGLTSTRWTLAAGSVEERRCRGVEGDREDVRSELPQPAHVVGAHGRGIRQDRHRHLGHLADPLLEQDEGVVVRVGMGNHGDAHALELTPVIPASDPRDDVVVVNGGPIHADEIAVRIVA